MSGGRSAKETRHSAVICPRCGAELNRSERIEARAGGAVRVAIGKCIGCGGEYDGGTKEYFRLYADILARGKDDTLLRLGMKGAMDGARYEITGRVRYRREEEHGGGVIDMWHALSPGGGSLWFMDADGEMRALKEHPAVTGVEGRGRAARPAFRRTGEGSAPSFRVVFKEGRLPFRVETGDPVQVESRRSGGRIYVAMRGKVGALHASGRRVHRKKLVRSFLEDEYDDQYVSTVRNRRRYRAKARVYLLAMIAAYGLAFMAHRSGAPVEILKERRVVLPGREQADRQSGFHGSGTVYGPVTLSNSRNLHEIRIRVDDSAGMPPGGPCAVRVALIREDNVSGEIKDSLDRAAGPAARAPVKGYFDDAANGPDSVESYSFEEDLRPGGEFGAAGRWRSAGTRVDRRFSLDTAGAYYVYVEILKRWGGDTEPVLLSLREGVRGARYFLAAGVLLSLLMLVNWHRARTYSEIPFSFISR